MRRFHYPRLEHNIGVLLFAVAVVVFGFMGVLFLRRGEFLGPLFLFAIVLEFGFGAAEGVYVSSDRRRLVVVNRLRWVVLQSSTVAGGSIVPRFSGSVAGLHLRDGSRVVASGIRARPLGSNQKARRVLDDLLTYIGVYGSS